MWPSFLGLESREWGRVLIPTHPGVSLWGEVRSPWAVVPALASMAISGTDQNQF